MIDDSQRKAAKVFGVTYLLTFVIVTVAFFRFYVPLIGTTSTDTARNIFENQHAFRLYLASALMYGVGLVVLLVALYVILSPLAVGSPCSRRLPDWYTRSCGS